MFNVLIRLHYNTRDKPSPGSTQVRCVFGASQFQTRES